MKKHTTIPVGTPVFVIGQDDVILKLVVIEQEWWTGNTEHPVYYDLINNHGEFVSTPGTITWHFDDLYLSFDDAKSELNTRLKASLEENINGQV